MRRSKNCQKTQRNYRSISQRRMTKDPNDVGRDGNDDSCSDHEQELERLRNVIRKGITVAPGTAVDDVDDGGRKTKKNGRKRGRTEMASTASNGEEEFTNNSNNRDFTCNNLLSEEMRQELGADIDEYGANATVVLSKKKKKSSSRGSSSSDAVAAVALTPYELRQAVKERKNASRKLKQLERAARKKQLRATLYEKLQRTAIKATPETRRGLLVSSANLGKKQTKREQLQKLLHRERAGMQLTEQERDLLYRRGSNHRGIVDDDEHPASGRDGDGDTAAVRSSTSKDEKVTCSSSEVSSSSSMTAAVVSDEKEHLPDDDTSTSCKRSSSQCCNAADTGGCTPDDDSKKKKKTKSQRTEEVVAGPEKQRQEQEQQKPPRLEKEDAEEAQEAERSCDTKGPITASITSGASVVAKQQQEEERTNVESQKSAIRQPARSAAAALMASLSQLKTNAKAAAEKAKEEEGRRRKQKEQEEKAAAAVAAKGAAVPYVPTQPAILKTAATLGLSSCSTCTETDRRKYNRVLPVRRPTELDEVRNALPVVGMEFEIMDAVKNRDVTIVCGETGSGKSTQVPQFLYEAGFTTATTKTTMPTTAIMPETSPFPSYMIGVTQPRRVAAISTAKRIRYEMGCCGGGGGAADNQNGASTRKGSKSNNGNTKKHSNLVAYQTRYETSGLVPGRTHLKIMTDGILLQEIQSDLLLRKYSVIVLDEIHERNLNTDCLLGLLSATVKLRKEAAAAAAAGATEADDDESSLPPLKLVLMSATLRVQDFTDNPKLFPEESVKTAVVKIPGRTHPVTVHHAKVTELDQYEDVAFRKVCKIHRKLPPGGILVFLTGKDEILRMVRRLRKALNPKSSATTSTSTTTTKTEGGDSHWHDVVVSARDDNNNNNTRDGQEEVIREMDDDEVDADLFQRSLADASSPDDFDANELNDDCNDNDDNDGVLVASESGATSNIPEKLLVLPLYSLLSAQDQGKVFAPVPDGHRLIVVATNIAETSITIPGISYVVDTGRQKCRNVHAGTGIASFDVMWISQAAANQRAGRAGRTGPGHAYRLYSSTMYGKHFDPYPVPEILSRPLEDVVLAMKAMHIRNIAEFPCPARPDAAQIDAAVRLLADLGCVRFNNDDNHRESPSRSEAMRALPGEQQQQQQEAERDGEITPIGKAVAKLPLGVRHAKILLAAAEAGVLDYAIAVVAALSEASPFVLHDPQRNDHDEEADADDDDDDDDEGRGEDEEDTGRRRPQGAKKKPRGSFVHKGGDVLACMLAVGAYTYAGRGAGGASEKLACQRFCQEQGLQPVIMERIQKMRGHLARVAKAHGLGTCSGGGGGRGGSRSSTARDGGFVYSMSPPNKQQELLLVQAIASGYLDHVAMLAPLGSIPGEHPFSLRSAYLTCSSNLKEPLFMDRNSVLYAGDARRLPKWVCYETLLRKTRKDGTAVAIMKRITPIEQSWLGKLAQGSRLLALGEPLQSPPPAYDAALDRVTCRVLTKFGTHGWEIPPLQMDMWEALQRQLVDAGGNKKRSSRHYLPDDSFRWFARFLLEGKVLPELVDLRDYLNDPPAAITTRRGAPLAKAAQFVAALSRAGIDSAGALQKHWATADDKFLFRQVKSWIGADKLSEARKLWIRTVKHHVKCWKHKNPTNK